MTASDAATNKKLVIEAITGAFVDRDPTIVDTHFAPDYRQHNPMIPDGSASIVAVMGSLPLAFEYEMGMVVAEGDLVVIHGRYTGWAPKPLVAVDIFRVAEGKLVEHWDVMQEEAETVSGNPMFTNPQV